MENTTSQPYLYSYRSKSNSFLTNASRWLNGGIKRAFDICGAALGLAAAGSLLPADRRAHPAARRRGRLSTAARGWGGAVRSSRS